MKKLLAFLPLAFCMTEAQDVDISTPRKFWDYYMTQSPTGPHLTAQRSFTCDYQHAVYLDYNKKYNVNGKIWAMLSYIDDNPDPGPFRRTFDKFIVEANTLRYFTTSWGWDVNRVILVDLFPNYRFYLTANATEDGTAVTAVCLAVEGVGVK